MPLSHADVMKFKLSRKVSLSECECGERGCWCLLGCSSARFPEWENLHHNYLWNLENGPKMEEKKNPKQSVGNSGCVAEYAFC